MKTKTVLIKVVIPEGDKIQTVISWSRHNEINVRHRSNDFEIIEPPTDADIKKKAVMNCSSERDQAFYIDGANFIKSKIL